MSSIWHRTLVYFGLAEDESLYDDDFSTVHDDPEPPSRSRSAVRRLEPHAFAIVPAVKSHDAGLRGHAVDRVDHRIARDMGRQWQLYQYAVNIFIVV
jgi:hypothetical protein